MQLMLLPTLFCFVEMCCVNIVVQKNKSGTKKSNKTFFFISGPRRHPVMMSPEWCLDVPSYRNFDKENVLFELMK